jgi:hypothetical protein
VNIFYKGVQHGNVVEQSVVDLVVLIVDLDFGSFFLKLLLPFLLELLNAHESPVLPNACHDVEHGRIPMPHFGVDLPNIEFEGRLVEVLKVLRQNTQEMCPYILQLLLIVIAIKLERTVHDAAIVEGGDR